MELRQLRYLIALAEELNFTRAAASEHVAQPALSQQIRRLEDEGGLALGERTTPQAALTAAGPRAGGRGGRGGGGAPPPPCRADRCRGDPGRPGAADSGRARGRRNR